MLVRSLQKLDKAFVSDVCKAPVSQTEMDQAVLDRVIAAHLFQQVAVARTCNDACTTIDLHQH